MLVKLRGAKIAIHRHKIAKYINLPENAHKIARFFVQDILQHYGSVVSLCSSKI